MLVTHVKLPVMLVLCTSCGTNLSDTSMGLPAATVGTLHATEHSRVLQHFNACFASTSVDDFDGVAWRRALQASCTQPDVQTPVMLMRLTNHPENIQMGFSIQHNQSITNKYLTYALVPWGAFWLCLGSIFQLSWCHVPTCRYLDILENIEGRVLRVYRNKKPEDVVPGFQPCSTLDRLTQPHDRWALLS